MAMAETVGRRAPLKIRRPPVGASPGTLIADPAARRSELRLTLISPEKYKTIDNASIDELNTHCDRWPVVWLDCTGLANIPLIEEIGRIFDLHPLALEDVVNTGQRPKVDFFEDHAFVVMRMIDDVAAHRYEQIAVFFGENFVVTFQEREGDPFDPVRKRIAAPMPNRLRSRGADYLAYALIDAIVDSYFPPIETVSELVDGIEDQMLNTPHKHQMRQLHELRRDANVLKGVLWPMRDALATLIRNDVPFVQAETKIFFNDTLDHALRLIELVETQRDMLTGLIEMHLSLTQARTNDVISYLTIVSVIFMPLTFLVGVWGMNFDPDSSPWNMPELKAYYGYPAALLFMLVVAVGLVAFFKWKKWL
ncbi:MULTISPECIES: magnesium/cobalt transporter CorA [unclassified Mesorhizobium]|uniref:magnesium/cobalt transporter CorA n=4 Tax=Mesorhizobium TaxID=68287 RepID=UPI000FCC2AF3|nr:magnesium/cobalt transporter CorA [Mesorhizobium sp. M1A.F.Ca.IN.020.04.1.1]RUW06180.1 magnesium/cobalt transporter CorA [Mesorhizobium sp. M1A.F.Ca.IN.020.03.1.1]RWF70852.1 MAG: magnesium/cobalt transporter CorA [Mesorhizobium sp.]RWG11676.1 MAG: magnesium/cobalt transporter CorA [Mesorhizobium sp.]RWG33978.1 MAG: magnesium/cobalt transporter CorA [Mesorhizobium sp.]